MPRASRTTGGASLSTSLKHCSAPMEAGAAENAGWKKIRCWSPPTPSSRWRKRSAARKRIRRNEALRQCRGSVAQKISTDDIEQIVRAKAGVAERQTILDHINSVNGTNPHGSRATRKRGGRGATLAC